MISNSRPLAFGCQECVCLVDLLDVAWLEVLENQIIIEEASNATAWHSLVRLTHSSEEPEKVKGVLITFLISYMGSMIQLRTSRPEGRRRRLAEFLVLERSQALCHKEARQACTPEWLLFGL